MIKTDKVMSKEELDYCKNDVMMTNIAYINKEMDKINQRIQLTFEVLLELREGLSRLEYDRRLAEAEDKAKRANSEVDYLRHDRDYIWKRSDELRSHMRDISRGYELGGMPCGTVEAVN